MAHAVDIGHAKGHASGTVLYSAAGQVLYSTAAKRTAVTAAPTVADQYLGWDGTALVYGPPAGMKVVAADVTHTQSNTTLSDITGLLVPVSTSATEAWFFEAYLLINAASVTPDVKFGWTVPTSATMKWGPIATQNNTAGWAVIATTSTPVAILVQSDTASFATANGTVGMSFAGMIYGGGTAGNVQMQFAQNTSNASDVIVQKGSVLRYRRTIA